MAFPGKMGRLRVRMCTKHRIVCGKLVSLAQWSCCKSAGPSLTTPCPASAHLLTETYCPLLRASVLVESCHAGNSGWGTWESTAGGQPRLL